MYKIWDAQASFLQLSFKCNGAYFGQYWLAPNSITMKLHAQTPKNKFSVYYFAPGALGSTCWAPLNLP